MNHHIEEIQQLQNYKLNFQTDTSCSAVNYKYRVSVKLHENRNDSFIYIESVSSVLYLNAVSFY